MQPHRIFLAIVLAALALVAAALAPQIIAAHAQQPSKCGAYAVGKRADGSTWAGVAPRMWVDREGWWRVCQPWIVDGGDPEAPDPKLQPGCPDQQRYEEWENDGEVCSSMPPGAYTGVTDWPRAVEHGRARLLLDEWGPVQGMLLMRCQAGKWVRDGAWCSRVAP